LNSAGINNRNFPMSFALAEVLRCKIASLNQ
jgi:hypothetical protein